MYLSKLTIKNFRKLGTTTLQFQAGLNVIVGANNVGKTAVVDALRSLLAGHDEQYPKLDLGDVPRSESGTVPGAMEFSYIFTQLSADDEADFIDALKPTAGGFEAHFHVRYVQADKTGRLRAKRWCGDDESHALSQDMLENLRGVYLPPLRDASLGLRPNRNSQLARLIHLLADNAARTEVEQALKDLDAHLKKQRAVQDTQSAISTKHSSMLGSELAQLLDMGPSATDFRRFAARLALTVDTLEVDQNGLGFNNLIYMAVVLCELAKNPTASYRALIIEEPEAHVHPQLQVVLLGYLKNYKVLPGEGTVQMFLTSHSANFASLAGLDSLACLVEYECKVESFHPRSIKFAAGKREKLERYLDVTRAELFFARKVIFVEGAAELMLVTVLAKRAGFDLRASGVSIISVEGLNFDSFLPLFGAKALQIPVAVITDGDPNAEDDADAAAEGCYPTSEDDEITPSDNVKKMLKREDALVRIFHGVKTLEYDLALHEENRVAMLKALHEIHPKIAAALQTQVDSAAVSNRARVLFSGMFERKKNNVQKGRFGQALAQVLDASPVVIPKYLQKAFSHVAKRVDAKS